MPAAWVSAGAALLGAANSGKQSGSATSTQQQQLDPRISDMLFGKDGGNNGLLSQYQGLLNQPQGMKDYQSAGNNYLSQYGAGDLGAIRNTATGLMGGASAPTSTASGLSSIPAYAVGNQVKAPAQNNLDLTGSFQSMLNGGNNSALKDSLKYGTDLTNAQFAKNQTDVTNNLMRNVMPSIRSNSVLTGQYGGSRQGVAEGNALSDYTNQLTSANTQIGLANSANTTGQLANDYEQGQGRALAAAQGLSQQQYATALQDANTKNTAEFMNVGNSYDASKTNAGYAQQTGLANQQAQLATNQMNNGAAIGGAGLLGGLTNTAAGAANSNLTQAQGVNSLLAPYLSANSSSTSSQPIYQNTAGNIIGGASAGLGLYNQYQQANSGTGQSLANMKGSMSASAGTYTPSNPGTNWDYMNNLASGGY